MLFCNDPLWNTRRMDSARPPLKIAEPPHFRNSKGLGLGTRLREHADVPWRSAALQPPPKHQAWRTNPRHTGPGAAFSISGFTPTLPICFHPQSSMHAFSQRAKWGGGGSWLKNSNLPLIKVFFENEYILRFEFSKNKNDKMVLPSKSISLSHIHRGRKPQTLHVPGTVKWPKCYKINQ